MKDFIFGTLATEKLRLEHVRRRRAGVSHYQARSPRDPLPGQEIKLHLSVGPNYPLEKAWIYWTNDGSDPEGRQGYSSTGYCTPMEDGYAEWDTSFWGYIRHFQGTIPAQPAGSVLRYLLSAGNDAEDEIFADGGKIYGCFIDDDPPPSWSQEAIVYEIFVDRFFPGKGKNWFQPATPAGFYGGTIKGITEKLDYLSDLGVNVLWLTPIFPSPSYHGYDATDFFDIEPRLGNKADLRTLLDESHKIGMRILLDLAPNHVSNLHPTFQSAIANKNSPYCAWYTFKHWPSQYETFFGVPELPQLNLRNASAKKHVLDAAAYWLDFGVDGYRVDYAIGPAPDFWADFRQLTRRINPDCWTFGEVVEPPDSQLAFQGGLDGCLDFNLLEGFRSAFAFREWHADRFSSFLIRHEDYFPDSYSRPSFLDNHDMNRFLWAADGDLRRLKLAALCQFTLSGAPVIYYGTEVGLSQERDVRQGDMGLPEESRLPMIWDREQNSNLLDFYRKLISLRKGYAELTHGKVKPMHVDKNVLVYSKGSSKRILTCLNLSDELHHINLPVKIMDVSFNAGEYKISDDKKGIALSPLSGTIITTY
jgi:cyclomaltodextrinase